MPDHSPSSLIRRLADTLLETTVIGSFTKIGPSVRSGLFDWGTPTSDMTGSTVLVTGGSSGLGNAIATRLVGAGARVYLTSRSLDRAEEAAAAITASNFAGTAIGAAVDTGDLQSVRALADRIREETDQLNVLIHNAGALTAEYRTNDDGMELTLASHLIGPYALTVALRDHLSPGARVLWMASGGMYTQGLDVDEIEMPASSYKGAITYA